MKKNFFLIFCCLTLISKAQFKVPEWIQNDDNTLPTVYVADIAGGAHQVLDSLARNDIDIAKRARGMIVTYYYSAAWRTKRFEGPDTTNTEWNDWSNWAEIGTGSGTGISGIYYNTTYDQFRTEDNSVTGYHATAVAGIGNIAGDYSQMVIGTYAEQTFGVSNAINNNNKIFVVGNGTGTSARSTAFDIGQNGYTTCYDSLYLDYTLDVESDIQWAAISSTGALYGDSLANAGYAIRMKKPGPIKRWLDRENGEIAWYLAENEKHYGIEGYGPGQAISMLMASDEIAASHNMWNRVLIYLLLLSQSITFYFLIRKK